ncbi:MAG: hypothetical protein IPM21_16400 [Acidobacteria bacterium]|nr:hypothetical protein [Acidobacteriota bacterium]
MNLAFRKRTPGDILGILKRRAWLLILPTVAVALAVAISLQDFPEKYKSTSFLTLTPPSISEKVAPSLTDENLSNRLQSIGSAVLSRSSLSELVEQYGLYPRDIAAGMPVGDVAEKMKGDILVEPERGEGQQVVGFRISYEYTDPVTAQKVTAELANRYIASQLSASQESAETTKEFIDTQLEQAKASLDALEQQRLQIMASNIETLPESSQGLIAQLQGLRQREQTIYKEKETLMMERGRVFENVRALNSQIRLVENFGQKETQDAVVQATRIEDTPAYAELITRRTEVAAKLENLKKQFRERHPDVIQAQIELSKVNDEIDKLARTTDNRVKQVNDAANRRAELQKSSLEIEREKAEGQIRQIDVQMQAKDLEIRQNSAQIVQLESRINLIPNVKVALEGVNNQYASAKANYDELLRKFNTAQQQVERESNDQGETIQIVDAANLPETPENASKKTFLLFGGIGAGLFFGLALTAFYEFPRLFRINSVVDAEYYTGLPVWAAIPPLLTEGEVVQARRRTLLLRAGGIAIAAAAVPVLALAISATRLFELIG